MKKFLLLLAGLPVLILFLFLLAAMILEYRPEDIEPALKIKGNGIDFRGETLKIATWNIGYAGLDEGADFFIDGGKTSKPDSIETVRKNMEGIRNQINNINAEIILLQEVDVMSSRSFNIMQTLEIMNDHSEYAGWFATNFKTFFVPVPVFSPIGRVWSGVMTVSKYKFLDNVERYSLSSNAAWPDRMFDLKRCMLVTRIPFKEKGNEIVIVNLHLSAYDGGNQREKELELVRHFIVGEYNSGNFVIAAGDWNHILPGFDMDSFGDYTTSEENLFWVKKLPEKWTPDGWSWAYGKDVATVRSNEAPYKPGRNFTNVIDGFLLSPGINLINVQTVKTGFKYSDHEPVIIEIDFVTEVRPDEKL